MNFASPQARDPLINWHFGAFVECFDVKSMLTKTHCAAKLLGCQTQTRSMGFQPSSVRKVYTAFNPWLFDAICNSHGVSFFHPSLHSLFKANKELRTQPEIKLKSPSETQNWFQDQLPFPFPQCSVSTRWAPGCGKSSIKPWNHREITWNGQLFMTTMPEIPTLDRSGVYR